jgi:catechol 2,3-dioxygenase-like lactoylglutathione lyase family enzyme
MADCTLGPIVGVTITTPDLRASEDAYVTHLGYRVTGRGRVSSAQAQAWDRMGCVGRPFLTATPAGGDDFSFRFIEDRSATHYRAFAQHGWNAAELIVADVDGMARRLRQGPFVIVGEPQDLSFSDAIRAMQVRGPAGEILYLTQFKRELQGLPAPKARCDVDRAFIVIVGGPSLTDLLAFYTNRFGIPPPDRMQSRVKAMSEAFGLSPEHRYDIAALPLLGGNYIEADEMPAQATLPSAGFADLPAGISMVSFRAAGHAGGRAVVVGGAGELLELIAG